MVIQQFCLRLNSVSPLTIEMQTALLDLLLIELAKTFLSVAPCKLELLSQYSRLLRNADIHTVYGTDKEGHPICEIFRDNILKAAQEFFEKELCSQEETFFGEFPLSMFENKNIAKLIEHLKEKAELADWKEDEYLEDARKYAAAWEKRLEKGIKEKFIVFLEVSLRLWLRTQEICEMIFAPAEIY